MARLAEVSTCKITNEPEEQALTCGFTVERVTGIEPALSAWEADVLPLNYTRATCNVHCEASCTVFAQTSYRNR